MDLSIIIPHYNNSQKLGKLLSLLRIQIKELSDFEIEIIIVDNGSTSSLTDHLEPSKNEKIFVVNSPKSPYICRNFGLLKAKGEWVLFFDTNVVPAQRFWIREILFLLKDPHTIYSSRYTPRNNKLTTTQWVEMLSLFYYNFLVKNGQIALIGNLLVHKEAFQQVGFFGETRNGEEIRWVEKAKELGYSIKELKGLSVYYYTKKKEKYLQKKVRDGIMDREDLNEKGYSTIHKHLILLLQMRPPNPLWINRLLKEEKLHHQGPIWYLNIYFTMWYYRIYQKLIALEWIQGTSD